MTPERDAAELIEDLERAARRSRPFLVWGLIAILAGFLCLSVYLYQQRAEEKARADRLDAEASLLRERLTLARALAASPDPAARAELMSLLGVALNQVEALTAAVVAPGTAPPPAPAATERAPPRLERSDLRPAREEATPARARRDREAEPRRPRRPGAN